MRVISLTADRLVLRHRTMLFMLAVGLGSLGYGVWKLVQGSGWKDIGGGIILLLVGVVMSFLASTSTITFDRSRRTFEARHRKFWGKVSTSEERLSNISAIVLNRDATFGNVLVVIAVRVWGKDLPITMFGTPFPAAAFHKALLISRFVGLPLMERDRMVIATPDEKMEELLGDTVFEHLPGAARKLRGRPGRERPEEPPARARPPAGPVTITCPNCGNTDEVDGRRVLEPSAYTGFVAARSSSGDLLLVCRTCGTGFVITPRESG